MTNAVVSAIVSAAFIASIQVSALYSKERRDQGWKLASTRVTEQIAKFKNKGAHFLGIDTKSHLCVETEKSKVIDGSCLTQGDVQKKMYSDDKMEPLMKMSLLERMWDTTEKDYALEYCISGAIWLYTKENHPQVDTPQIWSSYESAMKNFVEKVCQAVGDKDAVEGKSTALMIKAASDKLAWMEEILKKSPAPVLATKKEAVAQANALVGKPGDNSADMLKKIVGKS